MFDLLRQRTPVEVFDRAPRARGRVGKSLEQLALLLRFAVACAQHRSTLYLALSGGHGQILDLGYIAVSRLLRQRVFIHHHSFSYVDASTRISRALFALLRDQRHIVLSRGMAARLAARYGLDEARIVTLSNAAFLAAAVPVESRAPAPAAAPIRLGFLSNITFEKGFMEFFEVLDRLRQLGVDFRASIAGPVAAEARAEFERRCAAHASVDYVGAVYGAAKDEFYRRLDILLFPTKYANEAEPLVIHEALRGGVHVIACNRGAIADILDHGSGRVFALETFVASAAECIRALSADRSCLREAQRCSSTQAERLRTAANAVLAAVLRDICTL